MKNQSLDAIIKRDSMRDKKLGKTAGKNNAGGGNPNRGGGLRGRGRGGANQS